MTQQEGASDDTWRAVHHALHSKYAYIAHTIASTEYHRDEVDTSYGGGRVGIETLLQYLFTHRWA